MNTKRKNTKIVQLTRGEWMADAPPVSGRPGVTLRGATAAEAFEKIVAFLSPQELDHATTRFYPLAKIVDAAPAIRLGVAS